MNIQSKSTDLLGQCLAPAGVPCSCIRIKRSRPKVENSNSGVQVQWEASTLMEWRLVPDSDSGLCSMWLVAHPYPLRETIIIIINHCVP